MDSLSLKTAGFVSRFKVIGALHTLAAAACGDRLTSTALSRLAVSLNDSDIWWASPVGAEAHPRVGRALVERVAAHCVNFGSWPPELAVRETGAYAVGRDARTKPRAHRRPSSDLAGRRR